MKQHRVQEQKLQWLALVSCIGWKAATAALIGTVGNKIFFRRMTSETSIQKEKKDLSNFQ